jgi:hypothetical protein
MTNAGNLTGVHEVRESQLAGLYRWVGIGRTLRGRMHRSVDELAA